MFTVKHDQTQVDAFPLRPSHSQPSLTKHTTSFILPHMLHASVFNSFLCNIYYNNHTSVYVVFMLCSFHPFLILVCDDII